MSKLKSGYLIKFEGLNFLKFLEYAQINDIFLYDINKSNSKVVFFKINNSSYKKLLSKKQKVCYNVSVVKSFGLTRLKHNFLKRICLYIGLCVVVVGNLLFSKVTLNYNITGLNTIKKDDLLSAVNNYGIVTGKINKFENNDLELYLLQKFDNISLVSVMTKGNTLNINVKEKEVSIQQINEKIIAPQTMLITSLNVISGTAMVKAGDVVVKGKVLVEPYSTSSNGQKISCKALASITAQVWTVGTVTFQENIVKYERTGKKVVSTKLSLGKFAILNDNKSNPYNYFEEVVSQKTFNILPFVYSRTVYYETKQVMYTQKLDDNLDSLYRDSKTQAYNNLPSGYSVLEETQKVSKIGDKHIVQTLLKSEITINQ